MKAKHTIAIFLSLFLVFGSGPKILAQQIDEEMAIQEAELRARKDMLEQQQEEMRSQKREYSTQVKEVSRVKEASRVMDASGASVGYRLVDGDAYVSSQYFEESQTQLTIRNSFRGSTDHSKGLFDVDAGTKYFRCRINGKVSSGEIYIKVVYPDGKVFKEMTINSSAEIGFRRSLNIKEGEEKKYIGSWQYEVKSEKAEGNYLLSISYN